ncbi:hypothetical protein F6X40_17400 [Paraburkholderia sp. UCT31]|uniref:hypothetical protein n=1 Tax=Paraburkholderia sp. UCT31 TaxID=2615209 RepID=UPI0016556AD3|nr:hypothetical protein [Paraburkholderia sp. UCT31]MBC8738538.1 hypothetical protein [Paraburkholderia sp. UCT31]
MPKLVLEIEEEDIERVTLGLPKTTMERLRAYKAYKEGHLGGKLKMNYFVQRILDTLISDDKEFVKHEKAQSGDKSAVKSAKQS